MYDEQTIKKILKLKDEQKTTRQIAKELDLNERKLYKWFSKNNLKSNGRKLGDTTKIQNQEHRNLIKEEYLKGKTIQEIHDLYFKDIYSVNNINYYLRILGITRRNGKTVTYNESYFSSINTKEKAYFLGLLFADGSVRKNKNKGDSWTISLELKASDKYILEAFKKDIGGDDLTIGEYKHDETKTTPSKTYHYEKNNAYFRLNSSKIAKDLISLGCIPNKTYTLKEIPSKLPQDLIKYFILGFYDGNGIASYSEKNNRCYMGFCGTKNMMNSINDTLEKEIGIKKEKIYYNKSNNIYYLQFFKKEEVKKLFNYFYENKEYNTYLIRKKEKILKFLNKNNI